MADRETGCKNGRYVIMLQDIGDVNGRLREK
jgi:hypothetical protein